jgi:hypothetical protein
MKVIEARIGNRFPRYIPFIPPIAFSYATLIVGRPGISV